MTSLTDKELSLTTSMVKNFNGTFLASVNWDQVAVEVGYKDRANAKTMGSRLVKKLTDASAGSAAAADGDNQDAGEVTFKAGRKCKATGTAGGDASPVKAARSTKKSKAKQAQPSAVDKVAAPKVKTEDHASDAETEKVGEEDAA